MSTLMKALKTAVLDDSESIMVTDDDVFLIQNRLLVMLDDVLDVCRKYDIPYQMGGGSALGTVRHHGFIPWDDDIDINMTRADAERFLPLFRAEYGDKYLVIAPGDHDNTYLMIHIISKDVRARGIMQPASDQWGICLDIFLIENTPDNPVLRKMHGVCCMGYRYVLSCLRFLRNREELEALGRKQKQGDLAKIIRRRLNVSKLLAIIPIDSWNKAADKCMKMCRNVNSKLVSIPAGQKQYFGEMYERSLFSKSTEMEFEGRSVMITADYDKYLTKLYGDYMQIPPKEKREVHVLRELDRSALEKYRDIRRPSL